MLCIVKKTVDQIAQQQQHYLIALKATIEALSHLSTIASDKRLLSRFKTTAAQRAGLATRPWAWHDLLTYPTIV